MQQFSLSPSALVSSLWQHRDLVKVLTQRDVVGRYKGSSLGLLWSFFNPLFMLAVYTFVFSVVFQAKWGQGNDSQGEFALVLFAGLIVFNFFSECVNRAPTLILNNVSYVKKVVFPLEILPWVSIGSALFHTVVSLGVWLMFYMLLFGAPQPTTLLFPVMFLPVILLTAGLSWFLMALGVYVRDITQVVSLFTTMMMFLSPIFYPIEALPEEFQPLLLLNPLTPALSSVQGSLMWGQMPHWPDWIRYLLGCGIIAWVGFVWFQKTRKGFADVL